MSNARELAELAGSYGTGGFVGMKNRIINGAMMIDQRNAGASVTANDAVYPVDRFILGVTQSSKGTVQRSTVAPAGFTNSVLFTSSSAYSVLSTDIFAMRQMIEGFNFADMGFGTASAATVTVSFWVRSSLTGTFGGALANGAANRSYPFTYTINAANTWEQKSITIAGDTSGTWPTDNSAAARLYFSFGMGSNYSGTAGAWAGADYRSATGATSVVGTSGATFYITGVQLEKGSTATSFDYRPYGTELALCQRYAQKISADATAIYTRYGSGFCQSTLIFDSVIPLRVSMRTAPALTTTGTGSNYAIYSGASAVTACNAIPAISTAGTTADIANVQATVASGLTIGQGGALISNNNSSSFLLFTAEL